MGVWNPGPGPTDGNDVFTGDGAADNVDGGWGDDTLNGNGGNDTLNGGYGQDTLSGGDGDDTLFGADGNDQLGLDAGNDQVFGGFGDDWITTQGSSANLGVDFIAAGPGDDNIIFRVSEAWFGTFTIDGYDGFDVVQVNHQSGRVTFNLGTSFTGIEALLLRGSLTVYDIATLNGIQQIWGDGGAIVLAQAGTWNFSAFAFPSSFTYRSLPTFPTFVASASLTFSGSSGDDIVIVPIDASTRFHFYGGAGGNDTFHGGAAADSFNGLGGNDVFYGNGGDDSVTLFGGGVDSYWGGVGDDAFTLETEDSVAPVNTPVVATVDGGDGNDTLTLRSGVIGAGTSFTNIETTIIQYSGHGSITIAPGTLPTSGVLIASDARLIHSAGGVTDFSAVTIPLDGVSSRSMQFTGSSGDDTFIWSATSEVRLRASGGAGNDIIRGGAGIDRLEGGSGTNILDGRGGDDVLIGGAGTTFIGGEGYDTVNFTTSGGGAMLDLQNSAGNAGTAFRSTFTGIENFVGHGTFANHFYGDDGANRFEGGNGSDTLEGRGGDDILIGGGGENTLRGGAGNDILSGGYRAYGDDGDDTLVGGAFIGDGGAGVDTLDFVATFNISVDLQAGTAVPYGGGVMSVTNFENVIGSGTLRGDANANALTGLAGDDLLEGRRGADVLNGAGGVDTATYISSTQGVVADLTVGASWDGFETDILVSIENVEGSAYDDHLIGDAGDNTLIGRGGADILAGGGGVDTANYNASATGIVVDMHLGIVSGGDAEGDTLDSIERIFGSHHSDFFVSGVGADYFVSSGGFDTISYLHAAQGVTVNLGHHWAREGGVEDYIMNFTNVIGSVFDDVILGNSGHNTIDGGAGNDLIRPDGGSDTISGGEGFDRVEYTFSTTSVTHGGGTSYGVSIRRQGETWVITKPTYPGQVDELTGVEVVYFSDRTFVLDNAQQTFSGNGTSDFLWRNVSHGTVVVWEMAGATQTSAVIAGGAPANWSIVGVGDINGDGKDDLLWQNSDDGGIAGWLMDGATPTDIAMVGGAPAEWQIAGVGDFNFDGKDDLIWRNVIDGAVAIWRMDGLTSHADSVISGAPLEWDIAAVADFDGDGRDDILLRHDDGTIARWTTDGVTQTGAAIIGVAPDEWQIAGTGDFDGDGRADLIWRNINDGGASIWRMNGDVTLGSSMIGAAPVDWSIAQIGDFNADGHDDIIWRHTDGTMSLWTMDGFNVLSQQIIAAVPTEWVLI